MKRKVIFSTFVLVLLTTFLVSCSSQTGEDASGQKAPDFTLQALDGSSFNFAQATNGKVVILDFWATWCPPCRAEIPHFQALYQKYQSKGLEIVGVALDRDGASSVRPFVESLGVTYPIVIGNSRVAAAYGGVRSIPTTFVIDREGHIVKKYVGYQSKEIFEAIIRRLI